MKHYEIGEQLIYRWNEFDGCGEEVGTVTEVHEDHVIVIAGGIALWLDADTEYMFE